MTPNPLDASATRTVVGFEAPTRTIDSILQATPLPNALSFPDLKEGTPVFDVDPRTGFMASQPPLTRLPAAWELWESMLENAVNAKLQVGDKVGITEDEKARSERWRQRVKEVKSSVLGYTPWVFLSQHRCCC